MAARAGLSILARLKKGGGKSPLRRNGPGIYKDVASAKRAIAEQMKVRSKEEVLKKRELRKARRRYTSFAIRKQNRIDKAESKAYHQRLTFDKKVERRHGVERFDEDGDHYSGSHWDPPEYATKRINNDELMSEVDNLADDGVKGAGRMRFLLEKSFGKAGGRHRRRLLRSFDRGDFDEVLEHVQRRVE